MWRKWVGAVFFVASYSPLWLILAIRQWNHTRFVAVVLLAVAIVAVGVMWTVIGLTRRSLASISIRLDEVSARESDAVAYLVTYVLPLIDAPFDDFFRAASLALLLLVTGLIYVNSRMFYVNPVLSLLGYHLFEVKTDSGETQVLLSPRRHHAVGSNLDVLRLGDYVLLDASA